MKIIVKNQEDKEALLAESRYIHDFMIGRHDVKRAKEEMGKHYILGLDSDKAGGLMHFYMNPDMIEIEEK